jgi:hypothetical protein
MLKVYKYVKGRGEERERYRVQVIFEWWRD